MKPALPTTNHQLTSKQIYTSKQPGRDHRLTDTRQAMFRLLVGRAAGQQDVSVAACCLAWMSTREWSADDHCCRDSNCITVQMITKLRKALIKHLDSCLTMMWAAAATVNKNR